MSFKHIPSNTTKYTPMGGIFSKMTGKNDLIYTRNRWQRELDNAWAALMNMAHYVEGSYDYKQTVIRSNAIAKCRGEVDDEKKRNEKLYQEVFKCIEKDQAYQERMWKIHQDMYKTSNNNTNVSTSRYNVNVTREEMKRYVSHYPTTQTSNDIQLIKDMEKKLRDKRNEFRQNVSTLRDFFEQFKLELGKLESKYKAYMTIKEDGINALKSCGYNGSFFNRFDSAESKQLMSIDSVSHRLDQVEGTIKHFQSVRDRVGEIIRVEMEDYKRAIEPEFMFSSDF